MDEDEDEDELEPGWDGNRPAAISAVLCAGVTPRPPKWLQVELLAAARRAADANSAECESWAAEQLRLGGIRENAALVAVMETALRDRITTTYLEKYPDRRYLIDELRRWT
ncbi:hypothetical protein GCM10009557_26350 [Virgisporangium ochraceum]|uniref:Uncharacterized protein n=1 Tax=Virgisporangium ochraceum TaxID=65505 RepID=A0A8J4A9I3_9ACTN|nr:hypothetical protein Voc01_103880 [Virgisporangium ochraceum]